MEERYVRNLGAITEDEFSALKGKKAFVAGCGGIGGHIIDMLLRVGVGEIHAADGDIFEKSNLNRQLLSNVKNIGASKTKAAKSHAELVNPDVTFIAVSSFITEENAAELISGCDIVIDALDNIESRKILFRACTQEAIPFVHGAISGWTAQACIIMPGESTLEILYPENSSSEDKASLSFTPPFAAALEVSLAVKFLIGRSIEKKRLCIADLETMEFEAIQL